MLEQEALEISPDHFSDITQDAKKELISAATAALLPLLTKLATNLILLLLPKKFRQAIKAAILLLEKS